MLLKIINSTEQNIFMQNTEVAAVLWKIAELLDIKGGNVFKVNAYRNAARAVENISEPIEDLWKKGELEEIQGIGKGIAKKIDELLRTRKLKYYEELKKSMPIDIDSLSNIEGLGAKKIKKLYQKLKIKNLSDLERAIKNHKVSRLEGFGEKSEQHLSESIKFSKARTSRMLLSEAWYAANEITGKLKHVADVEVAGSLRRKKETIGDFDLLACSENPQGLMKIFTNLDIVRDVTAKGETKCSVRLKNGLGVDLRVVKKKQFGSALLYFTGSKEHNIYLRRIAISKNYKLSEYGLFFGGKEIAGKTEEEVYKVLGMQYIEPELRENTGEIELAQKNKIPKILGYDEIQGDLQMHTTASDGANTIEQMKEKCSSLKYKYMCITDHVGMLKIAGSLSLNQLKRQGEKIDKLNKKGGIIILKGAEINIKANGELDVKNNELKKLDIVFASIHTSFSRNGTSRIINSMENENVDIIAHPTGRLINKRKGYDLDMDKIFETAKITGTVLEVNSQPNRLDLNDIYIKAAVSCGCRLSINTDAHSAEHLNFMEIGIATARRGWAKKSDIINAQPLKKMMKMMK